MSLELYFHPLSSFCQKVLIALYENETPFERHLVDLGNEASSAAFKKLWPMGRFPVLRDTTKDLTIPESNIIIEYLDLHYPGRARLVPADPDLAWRMRLRDRFYDLYVNTPMQKVVTDALRPAGGNDPIGVEQARAQLRIAYDLIEQEMKTKTWTMGETFSMADCAAAPALYYANRVLPFGATHENVAAYLDRLHKRPSFARVFEEAQPYLKLFPK